MITQLHLKQVLYVFENTVFSYLVCVFQSTFLVFLHTAGYGRYMFACAQAILLLFNAFATENFAGIHILK